MGILFLSMLIMLNYFCHHYWATVRSKNCQKLILNEIFFLTKIDRRTLGQLIFIERYTSGSRAPLVFVKGLKLTSQSSASSPADKSRAQQRKNKPRQDKTYSCRQETRDQRCWPARVKIMHKHIQIRILSEGNTYHIIQIRFLLQRFIQIYLKGLNEYRYQADIQRIWRI
jgi:hypothetical protein